MLRPTLNDGPLVENKSVYIILLEKLRKIDLIMKILIKK